MHTKLLNVTEDKEGIFDLSFLHYLLKVRALDEELIDVLLHRREGQPDNQVRLERQLIKLQRPSHCLGTHVFENLIFGAPQEVALIHLS